MPLPSGEKKAVEGKKKGSVVGVEKAATAAAVVKGGEQVSADHPDFPSLSSTPIQIMKRSTSHQGPGPVSVTPSTVVSTASDANPPITGILNRSKTGPASSGSSSLAATTTPAVSAPSSQPKWSSLLSSSTSSLPATSDMNNSDDLKDSALNKQTKRGAKPTAVGSTNKYGSLSATNEEETLYSSSSIQQHQHPYYDPYTNQYQPGSGGANQPSVLSSGELKALISQTMNDIPLMTLPQSSVNVNLSSGFASAVVPSPSSSSSSSLSSHAASSNLPLHNPYTTLLSANSPYLVDHGSGSSSSGGGTHGGGGMYGSGNSTSTSSMGGGQQQQYHQNYIISPKHPSTSSSDSLGVKPPGISPINSSHPSNNDLSSFGGSAGIGTNDLLRQTSYSGASSSLLGSPASHHIGSGLLGDLTSSLGSASISRSQSKTYHDPSSSSVPSFLPSPSPFGGLGGSSVGGGAGLGLGLGLGGSDFSALPSLDENHGVGGLGGIGGLTRGGLGASSLENDSLLLGSGRTSSRFSSIFGNNDPVSGVGSGLLGNLGGNTNESLLGHHVGGGGLNDNFPLNYSFDNNTSSVGQRSMAPVTASSVLMGGGAGSSRDSTDSLFGGGVGLLGGELSNSSNTHSGGFSSLLGGLDGSSAAGLLGGGGNSFLGGLGNGSSSLWGNIGGISGGLETKSSPVGGSAGGYGSGLLGGGSSLLLSPNNAAGATPTRLSAAVASIAPSLGVLPSSTVTKFELPDLGKRLEDEMINTDSASSSLFPSLSRLSKIWGIQLFHWAKNERGEWIEYTLFLPELVLLSLGGQTSLQSVASACRCEISFRELPFHGKKETMLIIGPSSTSSQPIVMSINHLLDSILLVLNQLQQQQQQQQQQQAASSLSSLDGSSLGHGADKQPLMNRWNSSVPAATSLKNPSSTSSSGKESGSEDFAIADSMIDSLISPPYMSEKEELLASPVSSVSSNPGGSVPSFVSLPVSVSSSSNTISITASPSNTKSKTLAPSALHAPSPATNSPSIASLIAKGGGKSSSSSSSSSSSAAASIASKGSVVVSNTSSPSPSIGSVSKDSASVSVMASSGSTKEAAASSTATSGKESGLKRFLEIPSELIGLVIGHQGRKIKELAMESGSKVQFKTSKTSEKEGKPGVLEITGGNEAVDKAVGMVAELIHSVGKEFKEVSAAQAKILISKM
jgi:hypothetical protein